MKTITVDLVRHGQTLFNILDRLQGWSDSPLTAAGLETADATGQRLQAVRYDHYYSSDLKRAIDTAHHVIAANQFSHAEPTQLPDVREVYFGSFEGADNDSSWIKAAQPLGLHTQAEIIKQASFSAARDAMHAADPLHLSEDGATFEHRVDRGLKALLDQSQDGQHLLVVTHGTYIRSLVFRFGPQFDPLTVFPGNGSVTTLQLQSATTPAGFQAKITAYNQQ
ncbi:histidine phosphatase family protein [Levilactobacillus suantsaii]|uniref:histidine phosphatase family protein n=1 Tax=Levilactobacillus suantsaii TaxID=2292255 RepID=UPI0015F671CB|nr:histidine phosphatase family protein [Levilactobacillus suantsaii]QMU07500.1 histidine phosphatase family protein [Levilactobacillus suantsaii]